MEHVLVFFCYCLVLVVWNMPRVSKDVIKKIFDKFWPIQRIDRQRTQHLSNFWKRKTRKMPWMALKGNEWAIRIGPIFQNRKNGKSDKHGCKKSVSPSETYKQLEPDCPNEGTEMIIADLGIQLKREGMQEIFLFSKFSSPLFWTSMF
jgi:hypothetical protein